MRGTNDARGAAEVVRLRLALCVWFLASRAGIGQPLNAKTVRDERAQGALPRNAMRPHRDTLCQIDVSEIGVHLVALIGEYGDRAAERELPRIRIDHLMLSPEAADHLSSASIEKHVRAWEKPSDHVPVTVELSLEAA